MSIIVEYNDETAQELKRQKLPGVKVLLRTRIVRRYQAENVATNLSAQPLKNISWRLNRFENMQIKQCLPFIGISRHHICTELCEIMR